jgi:hypothetical protein
MVGLGGEERRRTDAEATFPLLKVNGIPPGAGGHYSFTCQPAGRSELLDEAIPLVRGRRPGRNTCFDKHSMGLV